MKKSSLAEISDLIRLQGPLTEDAVVKTLQARFYNDKYQVRHVMTSHQSEEPQQLEPGGTYTTNWLIMTAVVDEIWILNNYRVKPSL